MNKSAQAILDAINSSTDHMTAEQLYLHLLDQGTKMSLATVYNNLAALHRDGLVRKVKIEGCPDRYDKATKHDHLICSCCGAISDVTVSDLTDTIQHDLGIAIDSYDLKISYRCDHCRAIKP